VPVTNSGGTAANVSAVTLTFGSALVSVQARPGNPTSIPPAGQANFVFDVTPAANAVAGGYPINVQVSATDGYREFSESGPGFTASNTVPSSKLDARVPMKLTVAAAQRLGKPVGTINYLVPTMSDGKVVWGAYFKTGAIFLANARGKIIRRIS